MLKECGFNSIEQLVQKAIPDNIRDPEGLNWKNF